MHDLLNYLPLSLQRRWLSYRCNDNALADYLKRPLPSPGQDIKTTEFLVLDFETTGLDAAKDNILSVGYTVISEKRVILKKSFYTVIRQDKKLTAESVNIHQITDSEAQQGVSLKSALDQILKALAGRVLVAHHADIECGFLNSACIKIYGYPLPVRVVDTLQLEKRRLQRRHAGIGSTQLRLFNIRKNRGLPRYKAHNALQDAIATAELLLLQIAHICGQQRCRLKDL